MKTKKKLLVFFILICCVWPLNVSGQFHLRTTRNHELYVPGEVLVTFKEVASLGDRAKTLKAVGIPKQLHRPDFFKIKLPSNLTVEQAIQQFKDDPSVLIVQPNYRYYLSGPCQPNLLNDPYYYPVTAPGPVTYSQNWPLTIIHAPEAWGLFGGCPGTPPGSASVTVAVIDTGISKTNPDLPPSIQAAGYNFNSNNTNTVDDFGHGTFVAGIIGAQWNNPGTETCPSPTAFNGGMVGLAGQVTLLPIKVSDSTGSSTTDAVVMGIDFAWTHGARVLNLSLGTSTLDPTLQQALDRALGANCVIVAASGNDSSPGQLEPVNYPAAYPPVIAVGATDENDQVTDYSNGGTNLDLVAPGGAPFSTSPFQPNIGIFSTLLLCPTSYSSSDFLPAPSPPYDPNYGIAVGTSASAPYVSAAAALLFAMYPTLTNTQVAQRIINNADSLNGGQGWDPKSGYGRLNVFRTLNNGTPDLTGYVKTFNSPNPFYTDQDRYTNITLTINQPQAVELIIYDTSGEVVLDKNYGPSDLNNNSFDPQFKSFYVAWDGKNGIGQLVKTGVYFYAVATGGQTGRNKIAVIRGSRQ